MWAVTDWAPAPDVGAAGTATDRLFSSILYRYLKGNYRISSHTEQACIYTTAAQDTQLLLEASFQLRQNISNSLFTLSDPARCSVAHLHLPHLLLSSLCCLSWVTVSVEQAAALCPRSSACCRPSPVLSGLQTDQKCCRSGVCHTFNLKNWESCKYDRPNSFPIMEWEIWCSAMWFGPEWKQTCLNSNHPSWKIKECRPIVFTSDADVWTTHESFVCV